LDSELTPLEIGKAEVLVRGGDVALIGIGSMVYPCMDAASALRDQGIDSWVVNARFVKPLDQSLIANLASEVRLLVTVEENSVRGGFGSAVGELLASKGINTPILTIGLPDRFVGHDTRAALLTEVGLSSEAIADTVKSVLSKSA
jgi:1-deoxy-D-xylulose-5-phosphate synthase